jgi:hypothetical protein
VKLKLISVANIWHQLEFGSICLIINYSLQLEHFKSGGRITNLLAIKSIIQAA